MRFARVDGRLLAAAGLVAASLISSPAGAAELLTNGDFETGASTGWTTGFLGLQGYSGVTANSPAGLAAQYFVFAGDAPEANPLGGDFVGGMVSNSEPAVAIFAQDFAVADGVTRLRLSFDFLILRNDPDGGAFTMMHDIRSSRDFVDILPEEVAPSVFAEDQYDTLANPGPAFVFKARDFNVPPTPLTWSQASYDIEGLAPGAYHLRFASKNSEFFFDNVSLSTESALVPEPGAWTLMIAGAGLAGVALRRRRGEVLA